MHCSEHCSTIIIAISLTSASLGMKTAHSLSVTIPGRTGLRKLNKKLMIFIWRPYIIYFRANDFHIQNILKPLSDFLSWASGFKTCFRDMNSGLNRLLRLLDGNQLDFGSGWKSFGRSDASQWTSKIRTKLSEVLIQSFVFNSSDRILINGQKTFRITGVELNFSKKVWSNKK